MFHNSHNITFAWYDYLLFTGFFFGSVFMGIYLGWSRTHLKSVTGYLHGGKRLKPLPVALSLAVSFTSVFVIGVPADVYKYGIGFFWAVLTYFLAGGAALYVYMPVFIELELISVYEYLERRFDRKTRLLACWFLILHDMFIPSILAFAPSLAFATITGINVHLITCITCGICVLYTALGGLKVVVWTDSLEMLVILITLLIVIVSSVIDLRGLSAVWNLAKDGERLNIFDFDLDPTKRDSFWIIVFGFGSHWTAISATGKSAILRFSSLPTRKDMKKSVLYYAIASSAVCLMLMIVGLTIYARYSSCDPFTSKQLVRHDELMPFFIMDISRKVPGISGLFIASLFCASLSIISTTLNSLSAVVYKDFVGVFLKKSPREENAHNILKLIVFAEGGVCLALAFFVANLKEIFSFVVSVSAVTWGLQLGMFTLGVLIPKANATGTFTGALTGFVLVLSILIPSKYYEMQGQLQYPQKPVSIIGCNVSSLYNISSAEAFIASGKSDISWIFRISFFYTAFIGAFVTIVAGVAVSYLTKNQDHSVDEALLSPVYRYFTRKSRRDADFSEAGTELKLLSQNSSKNHD